MEPTDPEPLTTRGGGWRSKGLPWLFAVSSEWYVPGIRKQHLGFRTFRPHRQERLTPP